jgi:hypothetical protein
MSTEVAIALIASFPPTFAAILAFLTSRSVRQSIATAGEIPIGALVERLQHQVDALEKSVGRLAERFAHLEGREVLPLQLARRVERLDDDVHALRERVARIEGREVGA